MVERYAVTVGGVERAEGLAYLVQPLAPVGEVVVEGRQGVGDDRAVAGPDRLDLVRSTRARAGGRATRGRRPSSPSGCATTVVPRPSTVSPVSTARSAGSTNDSESAVWPGVATTCTSRPSTATTSPAPRPSDPKRYDGSSARMPHPTDSANSRAASEWSRWWWVSSTTATSPATERTASRCAGELGPGSTTTVREEPGSRSTHVFVPSSVIGEALSASTHTARSPNDPPDQGVMTAAAPRVPAASRGSTATPGHRGRRSPPPRA